MTTGQGHPGQRARTEWARDRAAPIRRFVRTESASAAVLALGAATALVWANVDQPSYQSFWHARLSVRLGEVEVGDDLRTWVNSGLMTLFFLVVGLETRRELDLGDLRERRRLLVPLTAGVAGMLVPVGVYLAVNGGTPSAGGWGVAMSTDTALALGLLAVVGRDVPERMRVFVLTLFVVDDLVALAVIAVVYTDRVAVVPLVVAVLAFAALLAVTRLRGGGQAAFALLGVVLWLALRASGIDPIVAGLAIGLAAPAYQPGRAELQAATGLVRRFREEPTPQSARTARSGLTSALSPNSRLQLLFHPWSSFVVVPLFAVANAGVRLDPDSLRHAFGAPVTLGVLLAYVVGKPVGIGVGVGLVTTLSRGRLRAPIGTVAVAASGTCGGIGFTVALLIAARAFRGAELEQAKLGALAAVVVSAALTWTILRSTSLLAPAVRSRVLLGDPRLIQDLIPAVDPERDHVRGPHRAALTLIEFGDFECPYCGRAEPVVRRLLEDSTIRYVWRHLPLTDVHPRAQLAAEASEAAAAQGAFWAMHDLLMRHQDALTRDDLRSYAEELRLDVPRFLEEVDEGVHAARVAQDVESADLSGVAGTPTFFVNGQRHHGAFDLPALSAALATERERLSQQRRG